VQGFRRLFIHTLPLEIEVTDGRIGIPSSGLTPPHLCGCSNPKRVFPISYFVVILYSSSAVKMRDDCSLC
jgi:hypothetical protein